uniref:Uncharacterized protein n=1 Tax=Arundo donax TaxID=35708 RepID=A0A0A9AN76_ARUDO
MAGMVAGNSLSRLKQQRQWHERWLCNIETRVRMSLRVY